MSKNKGGREVRKPKQAKKSKAADASPQPLRVERAGKPHKSN
jgi:hypothetical protein